ncbi:unnamed protein product [Caenorhabditis bovis]|uniref:Trimethyllysine dioxygenase, mitochondrial n=1 Tax=Caenorhabditis bovis TaxID=2654633 RepID=A0A8S1FC75_9PELO|nr:unnamed protein product [Caenorhabditis bovis]
MLTRRFYSSAKNLPKIQHWKICDVLSNEDALELEYSLEGKSKNVIIPFVWLRDHCSSTKYYNYPTNQRKSKCLNILEESLVKKLNVGTDNLEIKWKDGHVSTFDIKTLLEKCIKAKFVKSNFISLWDNTLEDIPRSDSKFLKFSEFAENLVRYGVVIVNGVKQTAEDTEELCKSLVPFHDTFFGQFWTFSNASNEESVTHEDTAYGNEEIGPHTDGTYFDQTPGIQVFHCLQPAETGGDTILVDGFNCAEILRSKSPEYFSILANFRISHHYLEGNPPGSPLKVELSKFLSRFNPYDRAPFDCLASADGAAKALQFYKAYEEFSRICHDPANSVRFSLTPGSVIFIDNHRVLHARTQFYGTRKMCGCYLSRDNFYAKARPFLVENCRRHIE